MARSESATPPTTTPVDLASATSGAGDAWLDAVEHHLARTQPAT
ncbi:MAG TPA: hypothetical protein VIK61_15820 [Acidimicrobiia bacterium]